MSYIEDMEYVTKRELNQNTAQVLDRVTPLEDVIITERGEPRWRISNYEPPQYGEARLKDLERRGLLQPLRATGPIEWPEPREDERQYTSEEIMALLEEMKGDH